MEMKDKLKQLRKEHDLTQAQLADAIFVSRSTVAKWENGLGLPSKDSMEALERLYGISQDEVATTEPETVIVEKNRKLHLIGRIAGWVLMLLLVAVAIALPFALHSGNYGFTASMAAGSYADSAYIDTNNCRFTQQLLDQGIAVDTGLRKSSGFCEYPLWEFKKEFLEEIGSENYAEYSRRYDAYMKAAREMLDGGEGYENEEPIQEENDGMTMQ